MCSSCNSDILFGFFVLMILPAIFTILSHFDGVIGDVGMVLSWIFRVLFGFYILYSLISLVKDCYTSQSTDVYLLLHPVIDILTTILKIK